MTPTEPTEPTEPAEPTEAVESTEPAETGSTQEVTESKYDFEVKSDCGKVIKEEELKEIFTEAKKAAEENGNEDYIVYVLEDGTTQTGSFDEKLSDVILIKCHDCEEEIKIDMTDNTELVEFIKSLLEEIETEAAAADSSELSGSIMGEGSMYALIFMAVVIAAAGSFIVIRRIRKNA